MICCFFLNVEWRTTSICSIRWGQPLMWAPWTLCTTSGRVLTLLLIHSSLSSSSYKGERLNSMPQDIWTNYSRNCSLYCLRLWKRESEISQLICLRRWWRFVNRRIIQVNHRNAWPLRLLVRYIIVWNALILTSSQALSIVGGIGKAFVYCTWIIFLNIVGNRDKHWFVFTKVGQVRAKLIDVFLFPSFCCWDVRSFIYFCRN